MVPDGGAGSDLDLALGLAIPVANLQPLPDGAGVSEDLLQRGEARSNQARPPLGAFLARRDGAKQAGIQTQAGNTNDGPRLMDQSRQQIESGEGAIGYHHQSAR